MRSVHVPRITAMVAVVAAIAVGSSARADELRASPAERETARRLMDQGVAHRNGGDLTAALRSFQAADAIMNVPTTGLEVARTAAALGRLLEAQAVALRVATSTPSPSDPPPFKEAREKAHALAAALDARIPTLEVELRGFAPDTAVTIDGVSMGATRRKRVDPGKHVLSAGSEENTATESVALGEGITKRVALVAPSARAAAPPAAAVEPPAERAGRGSPTVVVAGVSLAIIGAATGTVTGVMALSKRSDLGEQCPGDRCPKSVYESPNFRDDLDAGRSLATVSTIGFVAAGVGLAVVVLGLTLPSGSSRSAHVIVRGDRALLSGTF